MQICKVGLNELYKKKGNESEQNFVVESIYWIKLHNGNFVQTHCTSILYKRVSSLCTAIKMMSEYWIISAPGDKTCQQTFDTMNNLTSKQNNLCSNYKFHIPDLKVRKIVLYNSSLHLTGFLVSSPPRLAPWINWSVCPMILANWTRMSSKSLARLPCILAKCWRISVISCTKICWPTTVSDLSLFLSIYIFRSEQI